MSKQSVETVRNLFAEIRKHLDFASELSRLEQEDVVLLRDLAIDFAKVTADIFKDLEKGKIPIRVVDDAKCLYHSMMRIELKYLLKRIDKVWGEYIIYENTIKPFLNVGKFSDCHGEAQNILEVSRSRDKASKTRHYNEFTRSIQRMSDLANQIEKTAKDCNFRIAAEKRKNGWLSKHWGGFLAFVTLLATLVVGTSVKTIRESVFGCGIRLVKEVIGGNNTSSMQQRSQSQDILKKDPSTMDNNVLGKGK